MAEQRFLLCTDLDGTILGDEAGESAFRLWAAKARPRISLAYVTGRSIDSVRGLISAGRIPEADFASTAVGTEVWDLTDPQNRLGRHYREMADPQWPAQRVRELGHHESTPLQEEAGQGRFKSSFYWDGHPESLAAFEERLRPLHDFRLVVTAGRYIDVLPHCFSKGQATRFLAASAGVDLKHTIAAGDMEHDEDMLRAAGHAILPHNALPPLKGALEGTHAYFAQGREALGVMEGLKRLGLA